MGELTLMIDVGLHDSRQIELPHTHHQKRAKVKAGVREENPDGVQCELALTRLQGHQAKQNEDDYG